MAEPTGHCRCGRWIGPGFGACCISCWHNNGHTKGCDDNERRDAAQPREVTP